VSLGRVKGCFEPLFESTALPATGCESHGRVSRTETHRGCNAVASGPDAPINDAASGRDAFRWRCSS